MESSLSIGALAAETGCKVPTIRYFERIGLLPAPSRSAGNTRRYGPAHRDRLLFIQHCRELGFPQERIRALLELAAHPEQPCEGVDAIARAQLEDVEQRIARLAALRAELVRMVARCDGGRVEQCRIIETLAEGAMVEGAPEAGGDTRSRPAGGVDRARGATGR